jgi:PKD repeat protein
MMKKSLLAFAMVLLASIVGFTQNTELQKAENYFETKGEVYFHFNVNDYKILNKLTRIISIDKVVDGEVFAYANQQELYKFIEFDIDYEVLLHPNERTVIKMHDASKSIWDFDVYPTYPEYETMMYSFASNYPDICRIEDIGTTNEGRKMLFVVISDSVDVRNMEPRFMYTSSMHGDEITGYPNMLRLINYLLTNYGTDAEVTEMVNNTEIWISPLENPDGTYHGGDNTVQDAVRYNANGVDINRNYKNPQGGDHPDGNAWQVETIAMMNLIDSLHFVMSSNQHGGAEVANYPWDTWKSSSRIHADDDWWQDVSKDFADTTMANSPNGYFTSVTSSGYTNGGDWYVVYGSRQDYMTYYGLGRELTLEISDTKLESESNLQDHWDYLHRAWINYLNEVQNGFRGTITDSITGEPLAGTVVIDGHDDEASYTISELPHGDYYRPISAGTYQVTYDADGYLPKTYTVVVSDDTYVIQNARLGTAQPAADFTANPVLFCDYPATVDFTNTSQDAETFFWDFGDGVTSTEENPTHTYTSYGSFEVSLIATSANGVDTITYTDLISVDTLNGCTVEMPQTGDGQTQTSCTGTLLDSGGEGNYQNNTNSTITIAPEGAATVTLTFTSFNFESGYDYLYIYDGFDTSADLIGQYDGTSLPEGGTITSTYGAITLKQTSDGGDVRSGFELTWECTEATQAPTPDFDADTYNTCTGVVNFTDLTTNGPVNWLWDFGDDMQSTEQNPTYTYTASGTYSVTLFVSNEHGSNELVKTDFIVVDMPTAPSTTGDEVCYGVPVSLSAAGSGELQWYDAETDGNLLYVGEALDTTLEVGTTTFYVQDNIYPTSEYVPSPSSSQNGGYFTNNNSHGLIFTTYETIILKSVEVNASSSGDRAISLFDDQGTELYSVTVNIPNGISRIDLDFEIPPGTDYALMGPGVPNLYRNSSGANYPYEIADMVSITGSTASQSGYYYYFYDWEVIGEACASARTAVEAIVNPLPDIVIDGESLICEGDEVVLVASGGSNYIWSTGDDTPAILDTPSETTTYGVTVTENGCSDFENHLVTIQPQIDLLISGDDFICNGNQTTLSASGASDYLWGEGETTESIIVEPVIETTYYVTATDGVCSTDGSFMVSIYPTADITIDITHESAMGAGDGAIDLTIQNVPTPFVFDWSNGETTQNISGLDSGPYNVTITDGNGCNYFESATVEYNSTNPPDANFSIDQAAHCGSATINFTDESLYLPESWEWIFEGGTPATSTLENPTVEYLTPGTYDITLSVTNANGSDTYTIVDAIEIFEIPDQADVVVNNESVLGANDGSISITMTSGTSPYTASWSSGETALEITDLEPGNYSVTITDFNGCTAEFSYDIETDSIPLVADFTMSQTAFCGNGTVNYTDASYYDVTSWQWTFEGGVPAASTEQNPSVEYMTTGSFDVTLVVTSPEGSTTLTITNAVEVYEVPDQADVTIVNETVLGYNDGIIELIPTSGLSPYTVIWSSGQTTLLIDGLEAGTYTATITDDNGCSAEFSYDVETDTLPPVVVLPEPITICAGQMIIFNDLSENNPTDWYWQFEGGSPMISTDQNPQISYNTSGSYGIYLSVTNAAGTDDQYTSSIVTVVDPVEVTLDIVHETGTGASDGELTANVTGGVEPYIYNWGNGETTNVITGLSAGEYTVTVTDAIGCYAEASGEVTVVNINEIEMNAVNIYPVPVKESLHVVFSNESEQLITITDLSGKVVFNDKVVNTENLEIDMTNYRSGVYNLNVISSGQVTNLQFIKID